MTDTTDPAQEPAATGPQEPLTCTCGRSIAEPYGDKDARSWRWRDKRGCHIAYLAMYLPPPFSGAKSTTAHCPGGNCGDRLYFLTDGTPAVERRRELGPRSQMVKVRIAFDLALDELRALQLDTRQGIEARLLSRADELIRESSLLAAADQTEKGVPDAQAK